MAAGADTRRVLPHLRIVALALMLSVASVPLAGAGHSDCDGAYCCDRDALEVARRYIEHGVNAVLEAIARTNEAAGKLKCTVYEVAFLCSDETFPPVVSPFRTNPTNVHGHFSPCFEVFTPGFEHLAGCPTAHALRHRFSPSSDWHECVPLENIVLPSPSISVVVEV